MRNINSVIIHCSATENGKSVTVDTIRGWHEARGFTDIGYHFVIYTDGSVVPGRPVEQVGAHALHYNANSIGICLVGGVDSSKGKKTTEEKQNPGKYSDAQWNSLANLVHGFKLQYGIEDERVLGHRDTSPDLDHDGKIEPEEWIKLCPSFSVRDWLDAGMKPKEINLLKS